MSEPNHGSSAETKKKKKQTQTHSYAPDFKQALKFLLICIDRSEAASCAIQGLVGSSPRVPVTNQSSCASHGFHYRVQQRGTDLPYLWPFMQHFLNVMMFCVSVPVLSEKM